MKRNIRMISLIAACLLTAAMIFAGCGGGSNETTQAAAEAESAAEAVTEETTAFEPVGTYRATVDMTDFMNTGMESSGMAFTSAITADMILDLAEDGSFKLSLDGATLEASLKSAFEADGPEMLKQLLGAELSDEELSELAQQAGYESFDAMVDEMMTTILEQIEDEGIVETAEEETSTEGTYTIEGDKLTLSTSETGTINSDGTITLGAKVNGDSTIDMVFSK